MKYIIDLDGTLLNNEIANLDSVEFMNALHQKNLDYLVMTNSIKSPTLIQERLKKVGITIDVKKIMNPISAINVYLKSKEYKTAYVIGSPKEIEQLEVNVSVDVKTDVESNVELEVEKNKPEVIVLLDFEKENISYNHLQEVFGLINKGIPVITASRSYYYMKNGARVLDTGAFVRLLEVAGDIEIEVFGKPSFEYFMSGVRKLNTTSSDVTVIGDDWKTDVQGALSAGCKSVLVRSGKYCVGDEEHCKECLCVDHLMDILGL